MSFQRLEATFTNGRNQTLHTLTHLPRDAPTAVLLFHHGYGEHSGRYLPVFEWLAQGGIAVFTYDAHGHGRSEPQEEWDRHLIWDFQHMVDDWAAYAGQVRKQYPGVPCFIGGHSMGSLTSILVVLRDQAPWAGLVCCSATVDVEWNWFLRLQASIGGVLAAIIPRARIVPAVRGEDMSTDPQAVQEMENDPLNSSGNVRARTANEFLKAFRHVFEREHELELPIYAHHGGSDRLANLSAVRRMLKNSQSPDVTLHVIPNGFHEVMMGTEREDVTHRIIAWINTQVAHAEPAEARPTSAPPPLDCAADSQPQLSVASSQQSDDVSVSSSAPDEAWQTQQPRQPLPQLKAGLGAAAASSSPLASPAAAGSPVAASAAQ